VKNLLRASLGGLLAALGAAASEPLCASTVEGNSVSSPDGRLELTLQLNAAGEPSYTLARDGQAVMQRSRLGVVREDADFSAGLQLVAVAPAQRVNERYEMLNAKRRWNTYSAQRRVFRFRRADGGLMDIECQVSDDGAAWRYVFPKTSPRIHRITAERTSFHMLPGTRAWLQPMSIAKTGWKDTNPSYEELYQQDIPVGTPSTLGAGWVYPALFRSGGNWLLISEAGLGRNYAGTRLRHEAPDGEYMVGLPDPREGRPAGAVSPESTLPWRTPWRLVVVGELSTVAESMLGVHLADKPSGASAAVLPQPGKAAWSWPLLGDDKTVFEVQKQFIDYAAQMHWRYCLIDALWDTQIGWERMAELVRYARGQGVGILLWYNSAGSWNAAPQTPRDRMLTPASRKAEFEKLGALGVAGVKIDFFGGDGQSMIGYYLDILEGAAPYGLMINFHGATLPRGWQRTYPQLMTMEAVRGLEFITFDQRNADAAPSHVAMLPFTRNVFDPMDFTPVVLDRIPRIQRRTTAAFELAQAVLFTSGIQHYAEIPAGMARMPEAVRNFMREVPSVWDDMRLLLGEPGHHVVLARQAGRRWYVAGVNAGDAPLTLQLPLDMLGLHGPAELITDGDGGRGWNIRTLTLQPEQAHTLTLAPRGGFVLTADLP
jgi:alpha-glucosidase